MPRCGPPVSTGPCLENWDDFSAVTYDRQTWAELCSLRFIGRGIDVVKRIAATAPVNDLTD